MTPEEAAIEHGARVGGVEGVLLALGPDLTLHEWARALNMSASATREEVEAARVTVRRDTLREAAEQALRALAFGDAVEARRLLREGLGEP
jgi:hypothetical protein